MKVCKLLFNRSYDHVGVRDELLSPRSRLSWTTGRHSAGHECRLSPPLSCWKKEASMKGRPELGKRERDPGCDASDCGRCAVRKGHRRLKGAVDAGREMSCSERTYSTSPQNRAESSPSCCSHCTMCSSTHTLSPILDRPRTAFEPGPCPRYVHASSPRGCK